MIDLPLDQDTQSIGRSGSGRLENAFQTPQDHEYMRHTYNAKNGYNYATIEMAKALMMTGCLLKNKYGVKLGYGHLSLEKGGKFPPHQTHQSGRSADVYFVKKTAMGYEKEGAWYGVTRDTQLCEQQQVSPEFDLAANYDLIKTFTTVQPVERIYVDCNLREALKGFADQNFPGEWESLGFNTKVVHALHHHHHFHITMACPPGDTQCGIGVA
jgi:penicillin-insensitive murein endopeptidase